MTEIVIAFEDGKKNVAVKHWLKQIKENGGWTMDNFKSDWVVGEFINKPQYWNWDSDGIIRAKRGEVLKVRPSPEGNALCQCSNPEDAVWIVDRLNTLARLEKKLSSIRKTKQNTTESFVKIHELLHPTMSLKECSAMYNVPEMEDTEEYDESLTKQEDERILKTFRKKMPFQPDIHAVPVINKNLGESIVYNIPEVKDIYDGPLIVKYLRDCCHTPYGVMVGIKKGNSVRVNAAFCNPVDVFQKKEGLYIAVERALNYEAIPLKYGFKHEVLDTFCDRCRAYFKCEQISYSAHFSA